MSGIRPFSVPHTHSYPMYALDTVEADAVNFRLAVEQGLPYKPLYVKMKLIWHCNLRCGMCNHWRSHRDPPLRADKLKPIIDELAQLGCRKIHLSGGEPTIHPEIVELVSYMTERGIRVNMTTNGTLMTNDLARHLVKAGLYGVNVSIDSPHHKIHDQIRGMTGSWKRAVRGLSYLARRIKKNKVRLNTVVGQLNYRSLVDLPDMAAKLGVASLNLIPLDENTPDLKGLNKRQVLEYNETIAPIIAEKALALGLISHEAAAYPFGLTEQEVSHSKVGFYAQGFYENHRCFAPWTHALIDHVGQVSICCMLREAPVIGDLRQQSFTEIWHGPKFAALRQQQKLPLFGRCRRCDDFLVENKRLGAVVSEIALT